MKQTPRVCKFWLSEVSFLSCLLFISATLPRFAGDSSAIRPATLPRLSSDSPAILARFAGDSSAIVHASFLR